MNVAPDGSTVGGVHGSVEVGDVSISLTNVAGRVSAKAGDAIMAVNIPPAADKLRRLMNLGQIVQSHALSFFHLSAPDFLLGWDTPQPQRNVFGLIGSNKELARAGIRLRQFGQEIIEILGDRKIHPAWAVPGGVRSALSAEGRERIINSPDDVGGLAPQPENRARVSIPTNPDAPTRLGLSRLGAWLCLQHLKVGGPPTPECALSASAIQSALTGAPN